MELQDINLMELIESETGSRFNREGYICCPFHADKTPSLSVKFFPDANKQRFKCWGCNEQGDAIDFISKLNNKSYIEAREYLGLEVTKSNDESLEDKVKDYIEWQLQNNKRGCKLLGLFKFVDINNKAIYWKAKFRKPDGKKETPYYHIEGDKVINNRGSDEVPYNLYNTLRGIEENKVIVFVEGEKDANMINNTFKNKNFVATSIKGCKDLSVINTENMKVYVLGDTGEAGEKYKYKIKEEFFKNSIEYKEINLPGLKSLGDNKDVTDWLESGHSKKDLLNAFSRSLDLKNKFELQQDSIGIYKTKINSDDEAGDKKIYITDFRILEASRLKYVEEDVEGIRLKLLSSTGEIIERLGVSTVFDDVRAFRKFLGTMDLTFNGKLDALTLLKMWVNKYWAIEIDEIHNGNKFIKKDDKFLFVTNQGALDQFGNINTSIKSKEKLIELEGLEDISTDELIEVKNNLFKFTNAEKTTCIIGTIFNNLLVAHNAEINGRLHHLLIIGESGSGKTTITENTILPILNYPTNSKNAIGLTKEFPLIANLSRGNYCTIFEEYKPSEMNVQQNSLISNLLRNLYDRQSVEKGQKDLSTIYFQLSRPLVLVGEESYPNSEKAAIERSCIVYLSSKDRTEKSHKSLMWLKSHSQLLNKLGYSMIKQALSITTEEYKEIFQKQKEKFKGKFKDRPLVTAANISTGIELFNKLLAQHNIKVIENYEEYIYSNIKEEVLNSGERVNSVVENMIIEFNQIIEDGRAIDYKNVIRDEATGLYIRTSEMINQIVNFAKTVGSVEFTPLKLRDFRKQATKAGYILKTNAKQLRVDSKPVWFDEYSKEAMRSLNVDSIVERELTPVETDGNLIEGIFDNKGAL
ncbi:MAG: CHC2 zinc finger domain-containing protein [Clostridium sp.]|uniref:CHC2 zinc finger domain-containing protein n=1 Tax=Clostridium TaxID=1485 RepID=UPI00232CF361|nr:MULTISPECIES: CHC2 zinc finger domain-containing protein [Clostridium]MBS5927222.1 DNA primase [Clostridium sp.]MDB2101763.1 CHC2 zinc finger domain-containing protein [Clostridium paraputrificum]MDB2118953.1 CHC2 zinc finger domain-containing protein [Clostridium paraputrificum]MDU4428732.1 CHC2 zinc finger domain-containing protein [Clostridium sp.]MDU7460475.1 CHC2 zinc finger domain-containing protein [Clostridium sp.]